VDETLNTLLFASMALRVKSEPIVILDPAEQMVLDLKNTIAELRNENNRMAEALEAISEGMEPSAVLAQLADPGVSPAQSRVSFRGSDAAGARRFLLVLPRCRPV
jgi:hypothetical protein